MTPLSDAEMAMMQGDGYVDDAVVAEVGKSIGVCQCRGCVSTWNARCAGFDAGPCEREITVPRVALEALADVIRRQKQVIDELLAKNGYLPEGLDVLRKYELSER